MRQGAPMAIGNVESQAVHSKIICSRTLSLLTLVIGLALLTIFLSHSVQGPYSVVHGPATAFRAARSAAIAHASIMHGAMHFTPDYPGCRPPVAAQTSLAKAEPYPESIQQCKMTLRC